MIFPFKVYLWFYTYIQFSSTNMMLFISYQFLYSCCWFKHILWYFISITNFYIYSCCSSCMFLVGHCPLRQDALVLTVSIVSFVNIVLLAKAHSFLQFLVSVHIYPYFTSNIDWSISMYCYFAYWALLLYLLLLCRVLVFLIMVGFIFKLSM